MTRCRHPGCLSLARTGIYCHTHERARARAAEERRAERERLRNERRRVLRLKAALRLVKSAGYTVSKTTQPDAFPS